MRNVAQYFYPQRQTKLMNEGCATFVHYTIVNRLFDKGLISEGALLEILHSHANVVAQFDYNDPRFSGFNPYALGFAMMQDIRRICEPPPTRTANGSPTSPDGRTGRRCCATCGRTTATIVHRQFLSPRLIRQFRMFALADKATDSKVRVEAIHDAEGYRRVRSTLADSYDVAANEPDIQVVDADLSATGRSCCVTRGATASASPTSAGTRRCATSAGSGATRCASRRRAGSACEPGWRRIGRRGRRARCPCWSR